MDHQVLLKGRSHEMLRSSFWYGWIDQGQGPVIVFKFYQRLRRLFIVELLFGTVNAKGPFDKTASGRCSGNVFVM
jgi:hypothetical protein